MEFLAEYGLFFLKTITFLISVIIVIAVAANARKDNSESPSKITVKLVNDEFENDKASIESVVFDEDTLKAANKAKKKLEEKEKKQNKKKKKTDVEELPENRIYVLSFDGDVHAKAASKLAREVSAVLSMATVDDEIVLQLESPGGVVHGYGYAASQLQRIRDKDIPLTICVDKVAASGGYMMACIANKIIAAPFSMVGSIGVVAQLPNFNRLLKKNDIDVELRTAGEYKRTLTVFGENTDEGRAKFDEDIRTTHELFKRFVATNRPQLDIDSIATGEVWFGAQAIENKLVDELGTSEQYLMDQAKDKKIYSVTLSEKKNWQKKIGLFAQQGVTAAIENITHKMWADRFR